jgi:hypothetical protein
VKKISFGLLELKIADLERFWRKTPLGPLGVNYINLKFLVVFKLLLMLTMMLIIVSLNYKIVVKNNLNS